MFTTDESIKPWLLYFCQPWSSDRYFVNQHTQYSKIGVQNSFKVILVSVLVCVHINFVMLNYYSPLPITASL